jgi:hypothetical protein
MPVVVAFIISDLLFTLILAFLVLNHYLIDIQTNLISILIFFFKFHLHNRGG